MEKLDKNKITKLLKPYFEKRTDIAMAFLFGSYAMGMNCDESDVDIAVYFKALNNRMEWEARNARYNSEEEIWLDIERILGREVDLLVLNRAASNIADDAIKGASIIIKDRGLYLDFMTRVSSEAIDFREFAEGYWRLKEEMRSDASEIR